MIKKIIFFMILSVSTFALRINDTDLDLKVKLGERKVKEFILKNDNNYILRYKISLMENSEEVSVSPSTLLIPAFEEKKIKIVVRGMIKGEKKYKLILEEDKLDLKTKGSSAKIKMKYRIEQKYVVE